MNFLLVQYRPAIRLYKMAWALRQHGHRVIVLYESKFTLPDEHAWLAEGLQHVPLDNPKQIDNLAAAADVVVQFNPSVRIALGGRRSPGYVVFVGDIDGLRADRAKTRELEPEVLRSARGILVVSDEQHAAAEQTYGQLDAPWLAIHNGPVEPMLPNAPRPKLSEQDGKTHVVYSGTMARASGVSRDIVPLFEALLDVADVVVHVVPSGAGAPERLQTLARDGRLVLHETVPSRDLIGLLTQFDVGLVYVDPSYQPVRDTMRPNKLYEYVAAGLAVVANRGRALERYIEEKRAGALFDTLDEVPDAVRQAVALTQRDDWPPSVETWESQIPRLEQFFAEVVAAPPRTLPKSRAKTFPQIDRARSVLGTIRSAPATQQELRRLRAELKKASRHAFGSYTPGVPEWHEAWASGDRSRVLLITERDDDGSAFRWAEALNRHTDYVARLVAFDRAPAGMPNDLVLPAPTGDLPGLAQLRAQAALVQVDAKLTDRIEADVVRVRPGDVTEHARAISSDPHAAGAVYVPLAVDTREVPFAWRPGATAAFIAGGAIDAAALAAAFERADLRLDAIPASRQGRAARRIRQATLFCDNGTGWYTQAAVEAAAAGIPTMADIPADGESALIPTGGDAREAILRFFDRPGEEQRAIAEATRLWAERQHDAAVVAEQLAQVYASVLEGVEKKAATRKAAAEMPASFYDDVYSVSDAYAQPYTRSLYYACWSVISDRLVQSGLDDVLDIGCGSGQFAELLHAAGIRSYLGFDFSAEAIGQAEARVPSYRFETADARTTDVFDTFPYRVVTCLEVLEHVDADLDVVQRIRPGTRFLGTVPNFPSTAHVRWFNDTDGVAERYGPLFADLTVREISLTERTSLFLMDGVKR